MFLWTRFITLFGFHKTQIDQGNILFVNIKLSFSLPNYLYPYSPPPSSSSPPPTLTTQSYSETLWPWDTQEFYAIRDIVVSRRILFSLHFLLQFYTGLPTKDETSKTTLWKVFSSFSYIQGSLKLKLAYFCA